MDESMMSLAMSVARKPDPATWLKTVDGYIISYNKDPKVFILPKTHKDMLPLIEEYAYDLPGFVQFIQKVRDTTSGDNYESVHKLYRTINGRLVQQKRRERFDRALDKAVERYGPYPDYMTRQRWISALEQKWRKMRLEHLDCERAKHSKRLTREQVAYIVSQFWEELDAEIEQGDVPNWDVDSWYN